METEEDFTGALGAEQCRSLQDLYMEPAGSVRRPLRNVQGVTGGVGDIICGRSI